MGKEGRWGLKTTLHSIQSNLYLADGKFKQGPDFFPMLTIGRTLYRLLYSSQVAGQK